MTLACISTLHMHTLIYSQESETASSASQQEKEKGGGDEL